MKLLMIALFAVALALLLLMRVSERWLSLLLAVVTLGLVLLVLAMNVQVSGAGFASLDRMQGLLSVSGALLGGSVISLLRHRARAVSRDTKFDKFRAPRPQPQRAAWSAFGWLRRAKAGVGTLSPRSAQSSTAAGVRTSSASTQSQGAAHTAGQLRPTGGAGAGHAASEVAFQDYEVLGRVGIGGMGSVYRARRRQDGQIVALKVPQEKYLADAKFVKRFYREAEVLKRFSHPNIVQVYDYRMQSPEHYIAMEFLDGESLEHLLDHRSFTFGESVQVLRAMADALRHIHTQNVVHRDIKPANVMVLRGAFENGQLREGGIKLMDFGIAVGKVLTRLTMTGARVGTPIYMAPEQAKGQRVDARSDVYSLGLLAYELVTGVTAFKGSYEAVVHQQVFEPPKPPKQVRMEVPGQLSDLILSMVEKDPALRPTLDEVIARLDAGVLGDDDFTDPVALAVSLQERAGTVRLLDLSGKLRLGLCDLGLGPAQVPAAPTALAGDAAGNLYLALPDHRQGRSEALIRKLDPDGREVLAFAPYGLGDGQLLEPVSIAVWGETVYVLDAEAHSVNLFDTQGRYLRRFGGRGRGQGRFDQPSALQVSPRGEVYVLDSGNHEVQRFSAAGEYLSRYAFRLDRTTDKLRPLDGIGIDPQGGIYIADSVARKVRKIEPDGTAGPTFTIDPLVGEPLDTPWLLAINAEGHIYAARQGGQVLRVFSLAGDPLRPPRDMYAPVQALTLLARPAALLRFPETARPEPALAAPPSS